MDRFRMFRTLRFKVFLGLAFLQLITFAALGILLFRITSDQYFRKFQAHLQSITRTCAFAMDSQVHGRLRSETDANRPEYQRMLHVLQSVKESEPYVTYLYTLNYDAAQDKLFYAVDGGRFEYDTIWIEAANISVFLHVAEDGAIVVHYGSEEYRATFEVEGPAGKTVVGVDQKDKTMSLNGERVFTLVRARPLVVKGASNTYDMEHRSGEDSLPNQGQISMNLVPHGEPISRPGEEYIGDAGDLQALKAVIRKNVDSTEDHARSTNYGDVLYSYAMIHDETGGFRGLVVAEVYTRELDAFRRSFQTTTIQIFGAILVVTGFLSVVFARAFLKPLGVLTVGVDQLSTGNLETQVTLRTRDEFGRLAESFNVMVRRMKQSADEAAALTDQLRSIVSSYTKFVPHNFLELLGRDRIIDVNLGDQTQQEMTIFFNDIRSFTTLSEGMSPRETFEFINQYLGRVGPVIRKHSGFIDKYIGDAIMALFPQNPENAVLAAIEMQRELFLFNEQRRREGHAPIKTGIGIHTGNLILGTIGEAGRMEATVISDAVNAASRLEGLTKTFGSRILISDYARSLLPHPELFEMRFLGKIRVKGKKQALGIYEIIDGLESKEIGLRLATRTALNEALQLYYAKDFAASETLFKSLYLRRLAKIREFGIPDGWDGVEAMGSKK